MKIVCLGDSITGPRPNMPYLRDYMKWTDVLDAMLNVSSAAPAMVINCGYGGDSTEAVGELPGALNRLDDEVIAENPDVVVILLGANDARVTVQNNIPNAEARFEANLGTIVSRLQKADLKVLLLQYHTPRAANPEVVWHHGNRFNEVIARVGQANHVPVLAIEPAFAAASERYRPEELLDQNDGIHLRPAGELVYARAVFNALKSEFPHLFQQ